VQSAHFVGMTDWTGRGAPLHATANGKALLAFGDSGLPEALEPLTPRTIADPAALEQELDEVRRRGYATAVEELELGLHAVAAPVFDSAGICIAAVSVSGPSYRLGLPELDKAGNACAATAAEISEGLGYRWAA
jgi:DNA-binding IclR family transcriptional regulator